MDALILSCGTGGGHNSAAKAVEEELSRRGHHTVLLNPYTLVSERAASAVDNTYITIAQNAPKVFGAIYHIGELYRRLPFHSPVYLVNRRMISCMEKYLSENHFDVIITSHLFPAEILTNMKRRGISVPRTVFIATDYTCTPFTEETECDCYIIPAKELTDDFAQRGICRERLYPLGIPVKDQFSHHSDSATARKNLGLSPDRRYILISGGSMGAGKLEQVVDILSRHYSGTNVGLIVVCGSNRHLYEKMISAYGEVAVVLEHTEQMAEYMSACDLFITKPGGLSSSEAAVSGTPLIHITPIPGCESLNMRFFEQYGMSIAVTSPKKELIGACDKLMEHAAQDKMRENQRNIIHGSAVGDICDLVEAGAAS